VVIARPIPHEELHLLGVKGGPARDAYPKTPNTSQTHLLEFPAREANQRVLSDLPFVLWVVLYPLQGSGHGVLLYNLGGQVLGHVGDRGVIVVWQLRAYSHWGASILLVDLDAALTSIRPVASIVVDIVMRLLHGYCSSPAPS
jgi:hypothetical protein